MPRKPVLFNEQRLQAMMDRRGIVDRVSIDSMAVQFIRPRTVGVNVSKSF